jgi:hypothetical protein
MSLDQTPPRLPPQSPPVSRDRGVAARQGLLGNNGVEPAQANPCANLTGLAAQMCYATYYGIST